MGLASRFGPMGHDTRASGGSIRHAAEESFGMSMAMCLRANGSMIKLTGTVSMFI